MKIPVVISMLVLLFAMLLLSLGWLTFRDYPQAIIATTTNTDAKNEFYLNNELMGNENGFCVILRSEEQTEIALRNGTKKQSVHINNKRRFSISEPTGDNLGLEVIRANDNQELRQEFNCDY